MNESWKILSLGAIDLEAVPQGYPSANIKCLAGHFYPVRIPDFLSFIISRPDYAIVLIFLFVCVSIIPVTDMQVFDDEIEIQKFSSLEFLNTDFYLSISIL